MSAALHQSWPPFVLIAGLLLIGLLANRDGLFAWGGWRLQRLPGGGVALLAAALLLDAVVTAVLNLDTAVVFLTPVLIFAARRRRLAVDPFLYGCVFMANASSLFLPGSNLTNLLVLDARGGGSGASFAAKMFPIAITAAVVTAVGVGLSFRRHLVTGAIGDDEQANAERLGAAGRGGGSTAAGGRGVPDPSDADGPAACRRSDRRVVAEAEVAPRVAVGPGAVATGAAVVLVLLLRQPALAVLGVGLVATAVELARRQLDLAAVWRVLGLPSLAAAFVLTVALGTLARHWDGPAELIGGASGPETAGLAAISTVFVNNLPSAALYSAHAVDHSRMLLLGLNVGPNLAVTGALSALLWFRAAREVDARPSLLEFSRRGVPLALLAMAAAIVVGMLT
ncbi:MAG TPA: SLC13 family permease [Solirubrobacterales bacterium]|jgi:arsenical pump membrane protein|nr:SLC13 family permease [Solirubrobacterales bacterium]